MIDVHAPHERIAGFQDFLLHLLTITVGLLIALSLEGLVEWRHHVHLVDQARETLHAELVYNAGQFHKALEQVQEQRAIVDANLHALARIQENPSNKASQNADLSAAARQVDLRDTAWKTAQATGALGYMPYDEAERYADVYQSHAAYIAENDLIRSDISAFVGLLSRYNPSGKGNLNADAASVLAERCGAWRIDLFTLYVLTKDESLADDALLQGKPAPQGTTENLN